MSPLLSSNFPASLCQRRVDIDLSFTGIERRQATPAQIAECERRAERRFEAEPVALTNYGEFA